MRYCLYLLHSLPIPITNDRHSHPYLYSNPLSDYSVALMKDELSSLNQDFFVKCRYRRALAYFELQR
ncbi:hypothetical protein EON65_13645 [archaeon]|nr:MAG: hypothetical protein EON65_13645 [archaeon]